MMTEAKSGIQSVRGHVWFVNDDDDDDLPLEMREARVSGSLEAQ